MEINEITLDSSNIYLNHEKHFTNNLVTQNKTFLNQIEISSLNQGNYDNDDVQIDLNSKINSISNNDFINKPISVESNTIFIKENATNNEIQNIIDLADPGSTLEFLGKEYNNIALTINNKAINLVSYNGSILYGDKTKAIISIFGSDVNGIRICGLNLVGGLIGIDVKNLAMNVEIVNNSISNCQKGISLNGVSYCTISNNNLSNNLNNAIDLKDSTNIDINNNTISKNQIGIYYDVGNRDINIISNILTENSQHAINFDKSGQYTNVYNNTIMKNNEGIFVNCDATSLNIKYNKISDNYENGINVGENYRKTSKGEDFVVKDNVIVDNGNMNLLAKHSIYNYFKLDSNWVGSDERAFSSVCSKIYMDFYSLEANQVDSGTFELTIGGGVNSLPSYTASISFDGGKTWKSVLISNGKAIVHVSEGDGNVLVRDVGPSFVVTLKDYVPYVEQADQTNPVNPQHPITNSTQESQSDNDGEGSEMGDNIISPTDVGNNNVEILQASNSLINSVTRVSQQSNSKSSANDQTPEATQDSESQSASKVITVDEENIKIVGVSTIILLFIIIIIAYYSKDIKLMINNKK